jgi:hypothetical protein
MTTLICTSESNWLKTALEHYTRGQAFTFLDDAALGLEPSDLKSAVTLIRAARQKGAVSWQQVATILTGLGMSGLGIWMILAAIADPEPTSKLGILLAGGVVLALTGSLSILWALGVTWRVAVQQGSSRIVVEPAAA